MANTHVEKSLTEINWDTLKQGKTYYPSPVAWEDEVLYFLFVDRFSNGKEFGGFKDRDGNLVQNSSSRTTPLFNLQSDAWKADRETWFNAGKTWCGGHIKGIQDKLGYLKRMGVTVLWLNPIFEQIPQSGSYHGYGTFNFLNIDPRYGSREDLKDLVAAAHDEGIRIMLDIILNHAGDVFAYKGEDRYYYYQGQVWPVEGYRKDGGGYRDMALSHESAWPDSAVWPIEFQDKKIWTRKGEITSWDAFPEYIEGDFFELKEIEHGTAIKDPAIAWDLKRRIKAFQGTLGLKHLCDIYKFWIGYADIDGYRIDTVKHMEPGAVRIFANVIHEYAQSLGKENFYLIGEVTGGRSNAFNIVNYTGIDAALGINDIPDKLENLAKGKRSPGNPDTPEQEGYFDLFRNSLLDDKNT
ncbi:MAG: alpha-amylase, partial [Desulfobacterales bacterium]|nr:alpha-amylase [Desulfobacterales bacterium]